MKNAILVLVCVAFVVSTTSCKKDYGCKCVDSGYSEEFSLGKQKKSDAEDMCLVYEVTTGGTCSIVKK